MCLGLIHCFTPLHTLYSGIEYDLTHQASSQSIG